MKRSLRRRLTAPKRNTKYLTCSNGLATGKQVDSLYLPLSVWVGRADYVKTTRIDFGNNGPENIHRHWTFQFQLCQIQCYIIHVPNHALWYCGQYQDICGPIADVKPSILCKTAVTISYRTMQLDKILFLKYFTPALYPYNCREQSGQSITIWNLLP